jgi:hypothetical protein
VKLSIKVTTTSMTEVEIYPESVVEASQDGARPSLGTERIPAPAVLDPVSDEVERAFGHLRTPCDWGKR